MNACAKCGATGTALDRQRLAIFEDVVLGCPVALVNAAERVTCSVCGHSVEVVPNHEGLIAAVAACRIRMPSKLNGQEIRMLRKAMGLNARDFAKRMSVASETVSRWETGKDVIGTASEKYLRVIAAVALAPKAPAIKIDMEKLVTMDITPVRPEVWPTLRLERVKIKREDEKHTVWDKAEAA